MCDFKLNIWGQVTTNAFLSILVRKILKTSLDRIEIKISAISVTEKLMNLTGDAGNMISLFLFLFYTHFDSTVNLPLLTHKKGNKK